MRPRKSIVTVFVVIATVAAIHAQITSNPIPAPVEKRGLTVEIRTWCGCPTRGRCAARSGRQPGRLGAGQLRARPSRRAPVRQRLARPVLPAGRQEPAVGLRESSPVVSVRDLQPAGKRLHRLRLPSRVREERPVLHGARRARAGQSGDAQLHSAWIHREGRHASQRDHRVAREEPGGEHVRGHAARTAARGPRRDEPDAPDGQRRVQSDREAGQRRLRSALHERQRSRFQQRRRTERQQSRRRRSGSTRSSPPSCASIRAVRRCRRGRRDSATTRSRRPTSSPPTATRRRSARSTPTASATPIGSRGTSPTGRCSRATSA